MPFYENGYYHVYNRGVEKRQIFLDEKDYKAFSGILKAYLSPPEDKSILQGRALQRVRGHKLYDEVKLLAYCLMPNHFHLLIQQKLASSITNLMRRALTAYSMYFNEKYERVGSLFQGRFKAKEVDKDEYLLHLSRYIHRNPSGSLVKKIGDLESYVWSSYPIYLGKLDNRIVDPGFILGFFPKDKIESYKQFVEYETDFDIPEKFLIEED